MRTAPHQAGSPPLQAAGFSMFEILVTLAIITIWLLATAGVQTSSARLNKAAQFRTEAVFLANDIAERMEANKKAAATGTYDAYSVSCPTAAPTTCIGASCTAGEMTTFDLADWASRVCAALPGASGTLTFAATVPPSYAITLGWTDRRDNITYRENGTTEPGTYTATKTLLLDPGT